MKERGYTVRRKGVADMGQTYFKKPCFVCGQRVTSNGLGFSGHMGGHISAGLVRRQTVEIPDVRKGQHTFYTATEYVLTDAGRAFIAGREQKT